MVVALGTGTRLLVVREIQEDESGAVLRFQQGGHGRLAVGDANYATHLRLARRSQELQHPIGVNFGEGHTITDLIHADNDLPSQLLEDEAGHARVFFQGHDGVFRVRPDHPASARLRALLGEALRQKARVWFIVQKPDLALLDVLPAEGAAVAPQTGDGGGSGAALEAVEYRDAGHGGFESALRERDQPLSEEARARKQTFGELADRFIERLRTTKLTGGTEVTILYQCIDQQGDAFPPIRTSITPRTTVRFPGHQAEARVFAAAMHLDSLIGNINALVRNAPTGFVSFPEHPGVAVQIRGFELEIDQPAQQGGA